MSARVILDNIRATNSSASFSEQMIFEVTFTVVQPTLYPISWKITYVGSAYDEEHDQTLEEFEIDPIENAGLMKFDIACKAPDASKIPRKELLCVTALLITASYRNQQFIRVGYYIHNQLITQQGQQLNPDDLPISELTKRIKRTIISDKPRVTKFNIQWQQKKKKPQLTQQSQSKLSDYFSASNKSQNEDSCSQKIQNKEDNQKQLTYQESQVMVPE